MINWSSVDVIDPLMDEVIIVKNKGSTKLIILDSRHGIEHNILTLLESGFIKWSDTNG